MKQTLFRQCLYLLPPKKPQHSAIKVAFQKAKISTTTGCSPWSIFERHNPQLWQKACDFQTRV
jgi:hypothetical protein